MLFDLSIVLKVILSLFFVVELSIHNRHHEAYVITNMVTGSCAFLLWLKFFGKKRRKCGWCLPLIALIPPSIYVVFVFVINNLGGLGGCCL